MRRRSKLTSGILVLVSAALVAACGSSSKSSSSTTPTTAQTTSNTAAAPTGSTIPIGLLVAESGQSSSLFSMGEGIGNAWADDVNASGGIAGHKVEVLSEDTQSNPAAGLSAAQDLVQNKHVVAVIVLDTVVEASVVPYLTSHDIPILGTLFVTPTATNAYNVSTGSQYDGAGTFVVAKVLGKTKLGALSCSESPACAEAAAVYKQIAPTSGVDYVGNALVSATQPDYTAACLELAGKGADFIEMDVATATSVRAAQNCIQQGYSGVFGAPASGANQEELAKVPNSNWAGILNGFPWWVNVPAVNAFRQAVQKYAPGTNYETPTATSEWASLDLFATALSNATGTVTNQTVIQAYGQVKGQTLGGLLPQPATFTANGNGPLVNCFWMYSYHAGDANPTIVTGQGPSGNGQTGPLASTCAAKS